MRRRRPRKIFAEGDAIEIQRDVGSAWEPATYQGAIEDMRG